jgi:hypothetical protein
MDGVGLARVRWRMRGAWRWRAFAALTVADAIIGHALPPAGQTQSIPAAALGGLVLNLLAVLLLCRPLGDLLRRFRRDLPAVVARDYTATWIVIAVSVGLLSAGLAHRSSVQSNERAMTEAIARAQAFIGARAPASFRRAVGHVSVIEIQAGSLYRACVAAAGSARTFCVVVDLKKPFARSVRFGGYEPNSAFSQGVG